MTRRLGLLAVVGIVSAFAVPAFVSGPNLELVAVALALTGPACGTALAVATGRPLLAAAAFAGVGAYISGIASVRGVPVLLAVLCGCVGGALAGGIVAGLGTRLEGPGFLVATILVTLALGDGVQALPDVTGGQSGLGPLAPISLGLGANRTTNRTLVLTTRGDFHLLLLVAVLVTAISAFLMRRGPGPRWRAVGSDRARAASSGIRTMGAEVAVLVVAGAMSGICGALAAHLNQVATPSQFAVDAAALPLLAALCARSEPMLTALIAVATGVLGEVILPSAGWTGPPTAQSLALGILAVAALVALVPGGSANEEASPAPVDPDAPWPLAGLDLRGADLEVAAITCRSKEGALLVDAPAIHVSRGTVHAVVGPNGSGKTTLLREVAREAARRSSAVSVDGRLVLLPQEGGGFDNCSISETLRLAATPGRHPDEATALVVAWMRRLGFEASADKRCSELSTGQRRLVDLARVLLGRPNALLCDEPLAGLDDTNRAAAITCLAAAAAAGLTILVSEHDRDAVALLAGGVTELERDSFLATPGMAT